MMPEIITPDGINITLSLRSETTNTRIKTDYVFSMLEEYLEELPEKPSPQYLRVTIRRLKNNLTDIEDLLGLLMTNSSQDNEYD